jgi:hypothetical protein
MQLNIFSKLIITALSGVVLLSSCQKSFDKKLAADYYTGSGSTIQAFIGTVGASRNYVYVDGKPVNGSALTTGNVFPATGYGYGVTSGLRNMMVRDTLSTLKLEVITRFSLTTPLPLQSKKQLQQRLLYLQTLLAVYALQILLTMA